MCTRVAENRYIHAHAVREAHPAWAFGSLKPIILDIGARNRRNIQINYFALL